MTPEHCMNPFRKSKCKSGEPIEVYISGDKLPICRKCWKEISEADVEWEE